MSKLTNRDGHPYKSPDAPAPAPALDVRILKAENDAMWELATSRQREIDALTAQLAERDTTTQKVLNYWYPRLGYANANAMVYPPLEDRRAKEAPSLAERDDLRAKLAERDERFARMVELQGDLRDKLGERIAHLEAKLAAAEHRITRR